MIGHMRHGSPPRLMALQSIFSPNRRESLPAPSAGDRVTYDLGMITVSITWITPLDAVTSALLTVALSTFTALPLASIATVLPSTVLAVVVLPLTSLAITFPGTT